MKTRGWLLLACGALSACAHTVGARDGHPVLRALRDDLRPLLDGDERARLDAIDLRATETADGAILARSAIDPVLRAASAIDPRVSAHARAATIAADNARAFLDTDPTFPGPPPTDWDPPVEEWPLRAIHETTSAIDHALRAGAPRAAIVGAALDALAATAADARRWRSSPRRMNLLLDMPPL